MNRRGAALAGALFGIILAAGFATLTLSVARLRWLAGERRVARLLASESAAAIATRRSLNWDHRLDSVAVGSTLGWPAPDPAATDSLDRLGPGLFLARSVVEARAADGTVLARAGGRALMELVSATLPDSAAISARGPVIFLGHGLADGSDHIPPGWDSLCPPPGPVLPAVVQDTLGPGRMAPVTPADLDQWADLRVGGAGVLSGPRLNAAGGCDVGDSSNWGDPSRPSPCQGHFALVVAAPGTHLAAGAGQGLILGLGRIELANDFFYAGAIVSLGSVVLSGRAQVLGMVFSADSVIISDSAQVLRSSCATRSARAGTARPYLQPERWWVGEE